jgi:hypothetical protein
VLQSEYHTIKTKSVVMKDETLCLRVDYSCIKNALKTHLRSSVRTSKKILGSLSLAMKGRHKYTEGRGGEGRERRRRRGKEKGKGREGEERGRRKGKGQGATAPRNLELCPRP